MKQIFFDIGNVIVHWQPEKAIESILPNHHPATLLQQMYPTWVDLNLGKMTIEEAIDIYAQDLELPKAQLSLLFQELMLNQTLIPGMHALLQALSEKGIPMYAVSDNIREFIDYHKANSAFLGYFQDMAISADVGNLKPHEGMYRHLLTKHQLNPEETLFFDDIHANVIGAKQVGIQAYQFTDSTSCQDVILKHGLLQTPVL